jgi:hypothetical protein
MKVLEKENSKGMVIRQFFLPEGLIESVSNESPIAIACNLAKLLMTTSRDIGSQLIASISRFDEIVIEDKQGQIYVMSCEEIYDLIN